MRISILIMAAMLASCAFATVETKGKDQQGGATCKAHYYSAFKSLTEVKMTACSATGEAQSSTVDPAAGILLDILVKGLTSKLTPVPVVTP